MDLKQYINEPKTVLQELSMHRLTFASFFVFIFVSSLAILSVIGFVPEKRQYVDSSTQENIFRKVSASSGDQGNDSMDAMDPGVTTVPVRIIVESVGIDVDIENPKDNDIDVLDKALLSGAVRYPGSGFMNDSSTMFLFGHSSFLPVVNNKNFRAFNNLEKVKKGALIRVESKESVNIYKVTGVRKVNADDAIIQLSGKGKRLVLSTCNSFGDPGERFVLEAEFVESLAL